CEKEWDGRSRVKQAKSSAKSILIGASLFTDQMLDVLVILVTDEFRNFLSCRSQRRDAFCRLPRFLEGARVVECGFNFEVTQIRPPQARGHMELFGVRYGFSQPCLVV